MKDDCPRNSDDEHQYGANFNDIQSIKQQNTVIPEGTSFGSRRLLSTESSSPSTLQTQDTTSISKQQNRKSSRFPNIAEELAKNRKSVKTSSPSPVSTSSTVSLEAIRNSECQSTDLINSVDEQPGGDHKNLSGTIASAIKLPSLAATPHMNFAIHRDSSNVSDKNSQLKIASLLSVSDTDSALLDMDTDSNKQTNDPTEISMPDTIGLTNLELTSATLNNDNNDQEESIAANHATSPTTESKASKTINKRASSTTNLTSKPTKARKTSSINDSKARKTNSDTKKSGEVAPKRKTKPRLKSTAATNIVTKKETLKKPLDLRDSSIALQNPMTAPDILKANQPLQILPKSKSLAKASPNSEMANSRPPKSSITVTKKPDKKKVTMKKEGSSMGTNSSIKSGASSTINKAKTPQKLLPAPTIKSPSLVDVIAGNDKSKNQTQEPSVILNIPLHSTLDNDYLDANGTVSFNFFSLVQEKYKPIKAQRDKSKVKQNLLNVLRSDLKDDDEGDDVSMVDDEEEEDEEDIDEPNSSNTAGVTAANTNTINLENTPKKKSHPMKGKSLIGKYDIEDPFIDDSELLWEEQRASTKDGFFIYYGPLIEKGYYASLERANGTFKKGGVKNK